MRFGTVLALACTLSCCGCFAQQKCYYDTVSAVSGVGLTGDSPVMVMTSGRIIRPGRWTARDYHWLPGDRVLICYRHNDVAHRDEATISGVPRTATTSTRSVSR